jgi:uncharacterized OB-fold protein
MNDERVRDDDPHKPVTMMSEFISLDYTTRATDEAMRFSAGLRDGRIIGHRSRATGKVYVPPKGYDPLSGTPTTADDEVEVGDHGTVTGFTIIEPIQYYGQHEREPYCQASVLLDGADSLLNGIRIKGIPVDEVRAGMRVRAVWKAPEERRVTGVDSWGARLIAAAVHHFEPTGEPDVADDVIGNYLM